jgi:chromosome segregation ATPase
MDLLEYLGPIEPEIGWQAEAIGRLQGEAHVLNMEIGGLQRQLVQRDARIDFLKTLNAGNEAAISDYRTQVEKLQRLVDTARGQLEAAATERDELRAAIDAADKQLDQKDAQIQDLRIELDAAQQVPQPVSDEERERIWDDATEQAGRQVIRWLKPLTLALNRQPDERFSRFMALTLSILPDVVPELLGYAVEDETDCEE